MRTEEYEIMRLYKDMKRVMQDINQSFAVAISGLLAERLYEMGYRRQDVITVIKERSYNLGLVDGAKQFAEKLKRLLHDDYITPTGITDEKSVFEGIDQLLEEMTKW